LGKNGIKIMKKINGIKKSVKEEIEENCAWDETVKRGPTLSQKNRTLNLERTPNDG